MLRRRILAALLILAPLGACAADGHTEPRTIDVGPKQSIQKAVDSAQAGDVIVLAPGLWVEGVVVDTPGITIRGVDRSSVILDGEHRISDGFLVTADGVTIENLTTRNFAINGVMFNGNSGPDDTSALQGFAARYVTSYGNGLYGLYAFQSENGVFAHSYAAGSPDSGIYVGQCADCRTVVDDVTAEFNAVGFESVNATGVTIVNSTFSHNRVGMTPNSQAVEKFAPQHGSTIIGNRVSDNNEVSAPEQAAGAFGVGIVVGGGNSNTIERNLVTGNVSVGIGVTVLDTYSPADNRVADNTVTANGVDLGFWLASPTVSAAGNCFAGNTFGTSSPADIETAVKCGTVAKVSAPRVSFVASARRSGTLPTPPVQVSSPADPRRPYEPAIAPSVDLTAIAVPALP